MCMSHTSSCGAAQHHPASIDMLHLPAEALSCVFGNLCIVSLRALSQACQWACEQVRQLPWYSSEAGQPVRSQTLRLWEHQVEQYVQSASHAGRVFSSFQTLKYHARTSIGVPTLLQAVQTFYSTAARDDPRGLHVSIKGAVLQQLDRDAAVAYATALLDILATRPDLRTLRLSLPAHPATIARLAHLPGLRHLTLHVFHPKPVSEGAADPNTQQAETLAAWQLLGAVLGATRQVIHLTLEDPVMLHTQTGHMPIPPQLQECTQLQVFTSKTLTMVVQKPEHWAYLAGAAQLEDVLNPLVFWTPPLRGVTLPHVTQALLIPDGLGDLRPMLAALPALVVANVNLHKIMAPADNDNQVPVSKSLRELEVTFSGRPAVELSCCEALLAARLPQLRQLTLNFGCLGWPRAARGSLGGFTNLSRLTISNGGMRHGDSLLQDLQPIIASGEYVEQLELELDVYEPVDPQLLVDLVCDMPRLVQLTYANGMVGDSLALQQAADDAGTAVLLVSAAEAQAGVEALGKYAVLVQEDPLLCPPSSGEDDACEEEDSSSSHSEEEQEDEYATDREQQAETEDEEGGKEYEDEEKEESQE